MPVDRFFIDQEFSQGQTLEITEKEFHHLARVVRKEPGDRIELVNGRGALAQGVIEKIGKRSCLVDTQDVAYQPRPKFNLILAQGMTRTQKLDDIIEKGTELGVSEFWIFPGKLSEKKVLTDNQISRLKQITISALKQCGRLWLPKILQKKALIDWKSPDIPFYFGDLNPEAPKLVSLFHPSTEALFCVGPESGFSPGEIEQLRLLGACGVSLNTNTLRAETAAITAVGILASLAEF